MLAFHACFFFIPLFARSRDQGGWAHSDGPCPGPGGVAWPDGNSGVLTQARTPDPELSPQDGALARLAFCYCC